MSTELQLVLGHNAIQREKPSPNGATHDWTVFVRERNESNISHFVDKVVFYLDESFPKQKRVVRKPPYQVKESGKAGFIMSIDVHFRGRNEPKKAHFDYDLYLRFGGQPVHNTRVEKLTFHNSSENFRQKLLEAKLDNPSRKRKKRR